MRRRVYIVLPAYDEGEHLPALLGALRDAMEDAGLEYCVVVVDDGSGDRTPAVIDEWRSAMPLVSVRHPTNQGLGAALRDGLNAALERATSRDIVITMDADDTHAPGLILRMTRMLGEGYDVVVASRYRRESRMYGVPLGRRLLSHGASWLLRLLFPTRGVRDFTCGYRAYRADVLRQAVERYRGEFVNQDGFQCMVDILLKLRSMHLIFGEVPLLLRYDRRAGHSKMQVWRTVANTLQLVARRRLWG
ncbi:MAG: glycosyltransferase family 2 protein [Candidatus Binatia bacterium]